jgi:hypothetical protein
MNQNLAEQLQRARSDIAQVDPSRPMLPLTHSFAPQLVHERNEHAHGRRASDDKVRHQLCDICQQRFTHASQIVDLELLLSRTSAALGSAGLCDARARFWS